MHIAGGGELASEGAAEGVRGVDDGAAPGGSWQGWPGVEGVRAQELGLHAVHRRLRCACKGAQILTTAIGTFLEGSP